MKLSLDNPLHTRAVMVRHGIAPWQLRHYWSPDTESTAYPMNDREVQTDIRAFLEALWNACLSAEREDQGAESLRSAEGAVHPVPGDPSAGEDQTSGT